MSKIEWTGKTWNPVGGCKPVSPGCANCYAEVMTGRLEAMGQTCYSGLTRPGTGRKLRMFTGEFREFADKLDIPLRRKKPTTYFVNSMSDLFGEFVTNEYIAACFGIMAACPQHTFQTLTKRPSRMREWFEWIADHCPISTMTHALFACPGPLPGLDFDGDEGAALERAMRVAWPLGNVWLGVSVEDKKCGVPRIDELRAVPARVRFLSIEPLLEDLGEIDLAGIHWVIIGGESGHGARSCDVTWIRKIITQCRAQGVKVFVKQLGTKPCSSVGDLPQNRAHVGHGGVWMLEDRKGGDLREWPEDIRIREVP